MIAPSEGIEVIMNEVEIMISARLEGVYGAMRQQQAVHDGWETKCIGSGNCCDVGLRVSLAESWNISKQIKRRYWLIAEDKGTAFAASWYSDLIERLKETLTEDSQEWDPEIQETPGKKCVFFDNGCTIYEFRPMVCRSYGVIAPVQSGVCPRKRLEGGGIELIKGGIASTIVSEFDEIINLWAEEKPQLDYSMHIASGVLRFLLNDEEFQKLVNSTDKKFWTAAKGYPHHLWDNLETPVKIGRK